ncbi:MAG TPA: uracil-DNA glycosylase [Candidatus Saccharimonadales bacterium]|nr:uracil-DNA glycosylase [Candidatus Saccharimonadales bacterium]
MTAADKATKEDKQARLEQIKADIIANNVCPDLAKQATNLVLGDGDPDAEIVFIGEAPGKNEDLQGVPFVGAAGKFLNEMLESIGLKRENVYITNTVKYRPPNNRDPLPEEKQEFLPYLQHQLAVIQPLLIVPLGKHAAQTFLPGMAISQVHGQPKRVHGLVILPLFHPAAALYNGGMRQTLLGDFKKIPKVLELIKQERIST